MTISLWMGPTFPPTPNPLATSHLESAEITHAETDKSGFQLTFNTTQNALGFDLMQTPGFTAFSHVMIIYQPPAGAHGIDHTIQRTIMHGIVTNVQVSRNKCLGDRIVITGKDVCNMMNLKELPAIYPGMSVTQIIAAIVAKPEYAAMQIIPHPLIIQQKFVTSPRDPVSSPVTQNITDYCMIKSIARQYGYVCITIYEHYVPLAPAKFYCGELTKLGAHLIASIPRPLTGDANALSSTSDMNVEEDALAPQISLGSTQTPVGPVAIPAMASTEPVKYAFNPTQDPQSKQTISGSEGIPANEALLQAQNKVNLDSEKSVTITGETSAGTHGEILGAFNPVVVSGMGTTHNGTYYVKEVTHTIRPLEGTHMQKFTLTRSGTNSTI